MLSLVPALASAAEPLRARTAPVTIAGAPRSLVTLVVPMPAQLEGADTVRFHVVLSGAVDVVGRLEGSLGRTDAGRFRSVPLTLRVPANALVGLLDVADVVFVADDGRAFEVPIILRVPAVQVVRLSGAGQIAELRRGDRVALTYRVQNLGNATELLEVALRAPDDWSARVRDGRGVSVPAYSSAEITVDLRVPALPTSGSLAMEVVVRRSSSGDTAAVARVRTALRLAEVAAREPGVVLSPFVGVGTSGDGQALASGFRVAGPITERLFLRAEYAPAPPPLGLTTLGLASVGAGAIPVNASLASDSWRIGVGNAGGMIGELTGAGFAGQGATANLTVRGTETGVVAARPFVAGQVSGHYFGATISRSQWGGRWTGSMSSLRESSVLGRSQGRELQALGADYVTALPALGVAATAGLALRSYSGGTGLGVRFRLSRDGARQRWSVRAQHAPGGAAAFASATNLLSGQIARDLGGRFSVDAAGQVVTDDGGLFALSENRAASLGGRYRVTDWSNLRLSLSGDDARVRTSGVVNGGFSAGQRSVVIASDAFRGPWQYAAEVRAGVVERSTQLFSGGVSRRSALQQALTVSATRSSRTLGVIGAGGTISETGAGVGVPGSQFTSFVRWGNLPLAVAGRVLIVENELRLQQNSLERALIGYRGGFRVQLASGIEIASTLERNPFLRDAQGRIGWIAGLRVGMSAEVLSATSLERPGVVFQDLNANGSRDEGELGVAGVVLTFDHMRFRSGRDGRIKVPGSVRGRLRVDPQSIPSGYVVHPRFAADTAERREIALVPTGTVVLSLELLADPDGRVPQVNLEQADIWLRDAEGYEWVGRSVGNGRFAFEHVPVGEYSVRTSFARLSEPIRADEQRVRVAPGAATEVVVPVRGRNVRIIVPPRQGGRGGVAPRGGRRVSP